jgi:hypothetical protein
MIVVEYVVQDDDGETLATYDDAYWAIHHAVRRSTSKRAAVVVLVRATEDDET